MRLDGYFKGGLSCAGQVSIGVTGEVEAEIGAAAVYVEGQAATAVVLPAGLATHYHPLRPTICRTQLLLHVLVA